MKGKHHLTALHKLGTGKTMEAPLGGTGCETLTPLPSPREPPRGTTLTSLAHTTPLSRNTYTYIVDYSQRLGRVVSPVARVQVCRNLEGRGQQNERTTFVFRTDQGLHPGAPSAHRRYEGGSCSLRRRSMIFDAGTWESAKWTRTYLRRLDESCAIAAHWKLGWSLRSGGRLFL